MEIPFTIVIGKTYPLVTDIQDLLKNVIGGIRLFKSIRILDGTTFFTVDLHITHHTGDVVMDCLSGWINHNNKMMNFVMAAESSRHGIATIIFSPYEMAAVAQ